MNYFEIIKNDRRIVDIYSKIEDYEDATGGYAYHNFDHVMNVADLVEKLLLNFGYDTDFIHEAKVAAILHDIGCTEGKENHAQRSYEEAQKYLRDNNIKLRYEDMVLEAIKIHSNGFETNNAMALALILSDKLDIKCTRITKVGHSIKGNRQYQYISDILINLENNNLIINFVMDNEVDLKEMEEYYFTQKVFYAIKSFCEKKNLIPKVLINSANWTAFDLL